MSEPVSRLVMPSRLRSIASGARAVDVDSDQIVPAGRLAIGGVGHARQQLSGAEVGAAFEREFLHLARGDQAGALGAFRLHRCRLPGHGHSVADAPPAS